MFHQFLIIAENYDMKNQIYDKLKLERKMLEQSMSCNYLGVFITSDRNANQEMKQEVMRCSRISGCLRDVTWRNKYMTVSDSNTHNDIRSGDLRRN